VIDGSSPTLNVNNNNDFVKLSEKTFADLIKSDLLNVPREIYVYYALNKWIENYESQNISNQVKLNNASQLYELLYKHLRLNALSVEELEFILTNDKYISLNKQLFGQTKKSLDNKMANLSLIGSPSANYASLVSGICILCYFQLYNNN
jgi:hypothetical protein